MRRLWLATGLAALSLLMVLSHVRWRVGPPLRATTDGQLGDYPRPRGMTPPGQQR